MPAPQELKFWFSIDMNGPVMPSMTTPCWVWMRGLANCGYGKMWFNHRHERTHRIAWMLFIGPIPAELRVLHRCDNPPCCNPAHLFLGTIADNNADMIAKGRSANQTRPDLVVQRGERNGNSKLNPSEVVRIRELLKSGLSSVRVAREYGLAHSTVQRIGHRTMWRHIPLPPDADHAVP